MKKGGNGKRDKPKIPFVAIPYDVLFHQSFLSLSNSAKVIYLAMAAKVRTPLGSERYTFEIVISYTELKKWNFAPATISKSLKELETKGFMDTKECGGLKGCRGTTSKYNLTERFKKL